MTVLILCTGNAARSQIAEGLLRAKGGGIEVASAGVRPGSVRPEAVAVMREIGIDLSHHRSKSVDEFAGRPFDVVITVCDNARDTCPAFPAARRIHWSLPDPASVEGDEQTRMAAFRRIRNELSALLDSFIAAHG